MATSKTSAETYGVVIGGGKIHIGKVKNSRTKQHRDLGADELPPFSLIRDFRKQNTRGNVSKISQSVLRVIRMIDR